MEVFIAIVGFMIEYDVANHGDVTSERYISGFFNTYVVDDRQRRDP